jgi:hypothetical protein
MWRAGYENPASESADCIVVHPILVDRWMGSFMAAVRAKGGQRNGARHDADCLAWTAMSNVQTAISIFFALMAAQRLVLWQWHVRRDTSFLAKKFGPSDRNEATAKAYGLFWAAVYALAALSVFYV